MKRFLLLLICCLTLVGLSGCSVKAIGTWELAELTTKVIGMEKTYKIGDDYEGTKLTGEYTSITLKLDGTGTITMLGSEPTEITWEINDDDDVIISSDNLKIEAELEDGYLEFDMSMFGTGIEFRLTRKSIF